MDEQQDILGDKLCSALDVIGLSHLHGWCGVPRISGFIYVLPVAIGHLPSSQPSIKLENCNSAFISFFCYPNTGKEESQHSLGSYQAKEMR